MVKNLEVIEADVLSKEDSYQVLMQDKIKLSDECARMEVEASALRKVMGEIEARVVYRTGGQIGSITGRRGNCHTQ